jgi:uncharacterized membrane protein YraQ (UPF0718 family)
MSIVFEAMPFLVIGALVSGTLEELLPQQFFVRWLPKNRFVSIVGSSLLGILLPMCECGIVPVMRRLMRKGVPASCAITYMFSAPVINVIVLSSTAMAFWSEYYTLFGVPGLTMVLLRSGLAFVTAISVGVIMDSMIRSGIPAVRETVSRARLVETDESARLLEEDQVVTVGSTPAPLPAPPPRSLLDRLTAIADIALGDFLDIAAFLVIGAALAAAVNTSLERQTLDQLAEYRSLSILGMMGLASLLSLCSEADAFVAANFQGFGTGAKLGFLVLGPMLDVKLFIMYQWVFTKPAIRRMISALVVIVFILAQTVDLAERWFTAPPTSG